MLAARYAGTQAVNVEVWHGAVVTEELGRRALRVRKVYVLSGEERGSIVCGQCTMLRWA